MVDLIDWFMTAGDRFAAFFGHGALGEAFNGQEQYMMT